MKWSENEKEAARAAAERWRGTPHVHRRAIPKKGVDCVHFVASILAEAEIVEKNFTLPSYPTTWGFMSPENVLAKAFLEVAPVKLIEPGSYLFGDVIVFRAGKQSNHVGIVIDGKLWHVLTKGVVETTSISRHERMIQSVVRFTGRGWKKKPENLNLGSLK